MKLQQVFLVFLVFSLIVSCNNNQDNWSKEQIVNSTSKINVSGSGYRDLEGTFIEYEYVDFGSFRLAIYDNKIKWKGYGGYFDDIVSQVEPQISKVSDSIYFSSWIFEGSGGDNVVVNFKNKTVFAHLRSGNASDDSPSDFEMIHGNVKCGPSSNCEYFEGESSSMLKMIMKLNANTKKFNLPTIFETQKPLIQAHKDARTELLGLPFQYTTEDGIVSVNINNDSLKITRHNTDTKTYKTYVSKIAEGIYFISWLENKKYGQHIVLNKNEMTVFDHMTYNEERKEKIYKASLIKQN